VEGYSEYGERNAFYCREKKHSVVLMTLHRAFHPFIFQKLGKSTIIRNLAVPRHFVSYLVFFFLVFVWTQDPSSLLALKIRTPVTNTGKLRSIAWLIDWNKRLECTNLVDFHQLLCPWFTVVFVLFCIYAPNNQFPRPIVNQGGGLFWILSDSKQYSFHINTGPRNRGPTSLLALKIRTPVANTDKLRSIGQVPVQYINGKRKNVTGKKVGCVEIPQRTSLVH
jgi:hypothetical protein